MNTLINLINFKQAYNDLTYNTIISLNGRWLIIYQNWLDEDEHHLRTLGSSDSDLSELLADKSEHGYLLVNSDRTVPMSGIYRKRMS